MTFPMMGMRLLVPALLLALAACAQNTSVASRCLEHYQTDFGNQTKYVPCPAEHPDSPWLQGNR